MRRKLILVTAIFFLLLGGVLGFYENYRLPREIERAKYAETKTIYLVKKEIKMNTVITSDIIENYLKKETIPIQYVPSNAVSSETELLNKKTITTLYPEFYVYQENIIKSDKGFLNGEQLYSFPLTSATSVEVSPNSAVSVWVRFPETKESLCVIPKISMYDLVDATGAPIKDNTKASTKSNEVAYGVIKAKDYEMQKDLEIARKFEIYLTVFGENTEQPPEKTFNREKVISDSIIK